MGGTIEKEKESRDGVRGARIGEREEES